MPPEEHPKPANFSTGRRMESLLDQLQTQTRRVRDCWQAGEATRLRMLAAQLAALANDAGDRAVTETAEEIEAILTAEEAEAAAICERIEALIQQCKTAATPSD